MGASMQRSGGFQISRQQPSSSVPKMPQQMSTSGTHFSQVRTVPAVQAGKAQGVRQQAPISEKTNKAIQDLNSFLTENARQER